MGTRIIIPLSGMMLPDADGFERNTTIEDLQQGICGDVTGNGVTGDTILLLNHVVYPGYSLNRTTLGGDMEKS